MGSGTEFLVSLVPLGRLETDQAGPSDGFTTT